MVACRVGREQARASNGCACPKLRTAGTAAKAAKPWKKTKKKCKTIPNSAVTASADSLKSGRTSHRSGRTGRDRRRQSNRSNRQTGNLPYSWQCILFRRVLENLQPSGQRRHPSRLGTKTTQLFGRQRPERTLTFPSRLPPLGNTGPRSLLLQLARPGRIPFTKTGGKGRHFMFTFFFSINSKSGTAIEDFQIDWSAAVSADSIVTSVWTVPDGLTSPAASNTGTTDTIRLSGGTPGAAYLLTNTVTLTSGQVKKQDLSISVQTIPQ
jgi:hypothetical protein